MIKAYLKFCVQVNSKVQFNQVFQKNLRYFASRVEYWLIAVYFEFDVLRNPFKARSLFHRALAVNRTQPEFWAEYLLFEVKFASLMLQREMLTRQIANKNSKANGEHEDNGANTQKEENDNEEMIMLDDSDEENDSRREMAQDEVDSDLAEINFDQHEAIFSKIIDKILVVIPDQAQTCLQQALSLFEAESACDKAIAKSLQGLKELVLKKIQIENPAQTNWTSNPPNHLPLSTKFGQSDRHTDLKKNTLQLEQLVASIAGQHIIVEALSLADKKKLESNLLALIDSNSLDTIPLLKEFCEKYRFDESIGKCYIHLIRNRIDDLAKYLEGLKRGGSTDCAVPRLRSQSKKALKSLAFKHYVSAIFTQVREGRTPFRDAFELCFKFSDFDFQLLSDLSSAVLDQEVLRNVSDVDTDAFYARMTALKNVCPAQVFISQLDRPAHRTNFKLFETALTYHPRNIDLWKQYLHTLKSGLALQKAQTVYERSICSLSHADQANLAHFYNTVILED